MKKRNFINSLLQHTRRPDGFLGRRMLRGMNNGHAPLTRWGAAHIEWQPQWCVLDIGCGGGATLLRLLERCPDGMVCGVDASPESVEFSRRKTARYADRCSVEQATADDLPYGDRAFNAVTAFETVYFWGDLHRAFAEVARVLKPGGVFLVCCEMSNPGNDTWTSRIEGMQVFSPEELSAALADSGFTDIAVYRRGKENCCVTACTPDGRGNTFYIRMFFTEKQRSSSSPTMAFTNQRYA